jgi:PTH1 family peptidyl-tRNA hydrolase
VRLIVGLGNPGSEYQKTRHNLGFWVLDTLAQRWSTTFSRKAFYSLMSEAWRQNEKVLLLKPQTFMNLSGNAVAKACEYYHLTLTDVVVVHDDLDLPCGQLRIKRGGGGAGGNRGIASIIASLGSKEFVRVKIGIGRPPGRQDPAHFVLQPFTPQEEAFILPAVDCAANAIEVILSEGVDKAMAQFHTSESKKDEHP